MTDMTLGMQKEMQFRQNKLTTTKKNMKAQYCQMRRAFAVAVALRSCRIHLKEKLRCYCFEEE